MKSHTPGIHQPGIREAGAAGGGVDAATQALLDQLSASVAALTLGMTGVNAQLAALDLGAVSAQLAQLGADLSSFGTQLGNLQGSVVQLASAQNTIVQRLDQIDSFGYSGRLNTIDNTLSSLSDSIETVGNYVTAASPPRDGYLVDADADLVQASPENGRHGTEYSLHEALTADRTYTLTTGAVTAGECIFVRIMSSAALDQGRTATIVNGGPAGGTLYVMSDAYPRVAEFRFDGTNYTLSRHYAMRAGV